MDKKDVKDHIVIPAESELDKLEALAVIPAESELDKLEALAKVYAEEKEEVLPSVDQLLDQVEQIMIG